MNRRQAVLGIAAAFTVGIALRTWPLWHSPLPFNPDGIIYARFVHDTVRTGSLPLSRMHVDELAFTSFLTTISHVTGLDALRHAQPAIAVVGTVPVLLAAAFAGRIAAGTRLDALGRRYAAVLAAVVLAVEGLYLHRSMPVDEQTLGLALVPLALLAVAYASRRDARWWFVALPTLLVVPAVHNLDAFVLALALVLLAVLALDSAELGRLRSLGTLAIGFFAYFATYNVATQTLTDASINQQDRLTTVPGLILAWLVLAAIGLRWFTSRRDSTKRTLLASVLLTWFVVLAVNALAPIFPGLPSTHPTILYGIAPLVLLVVLLAYGLPDVLDTTEGTSLLAGLAAVVVLVGISLTASLTADYLNTLYRVQTFSHLPVVTIAAVAAARISTRTGLLDDIPGFDRRRPSARTAAGALAVVVVLASVASIPIAYGGLDVLPYKGVTTPAELQSTGFAERHVPGAWTSDDHLTRMTPYYTSAGDGRRGPTDAYLTGSPPPGCPMLVQASWSTTGAQRYPQTAAVVPPPRLEATMITSHVVYHTGGADPISLTIARSAADDCTNSSV
ncbi:hypothetical protein [Halorubellus litoreus]|uniref:Sodium/phosphate symporter n=1 Tax=Halorubellus litoreus TaxID=755308 RepID=A0ABD5VGF8_9EURY